MMKPLAYVGVVALGVSCLTASSAHAQLLPPADVPATSPATSPATTATAPATDRSPRSWLAAPPSKPVVATGESPEIPWKSAVLLMGVAAIGVFAWRHRNRFRSVAQGKVGARLSVAGSVRVGPKAHLVLANVGDRALLLGVTDDSVRRIAWIDQPAETPPKLLSSSPPAKKAQAETAVKSVGREVLKAAAASPAAKASPAPSSPKTPIIDARPRNFLDAMRAAKERTERSERSERSERAERAEREERPSEPPPDIEVAPSPYADSRLAELDSMPETRDSRPPPLESTPPPLESTPPPLESTPPPRATTPALLDSTPPPSTAVRSLPNAALEIAGTATDSVEWSRPATPRKRRNTIPKVKAAPLAEAPKPAEPAPEPTKSAPVEETVKSNAESAPKPGLVATPIEIAKPLAFTDVVRPVQRDDVLDQDALEGQAAGVLSRKVRRRV